MAQLSPKPEPVKLVEPFTESDLLHTGSTLLNLALSGNPKGGWIKGRYFYFVGDSSSGKTFVTLTTLAEATLNPEFDDYRLIYDDVEGGALMNLEKFFGRKLAERIEPPAMKRGEPLHSSLIEEFYFNLDDAFKRQEPFIYILDSQDALDSLYARKKFKELKTAARTETKSKGDYGDGKAKFHSTRLREVVARLRETESILIIVNQTRDVLDAKPFTPKSQTSGGRALKFYACAQVWTSVGKKVYKTINGNRRQIGVNAMIAVKKNRLTGKEWSVTAPIYFSHGLDDVGSCVEFLLSEGRWKQTNGAIRCVDFDGIGGNLNKVVREIEKNELQEDLFDIVHEVFEEIEQASKIPRKNKYGGRVDVSDNDPADEEDYEAEAESEE